jgi:hypothetical protein
VRRSRLPGGLAAHHAVALDSAEFAQIQGEGLPRNVAVQGELGHAGFHTLGAVDAVHHLVLAPGLINAGNFAEADGFVKRDGFIQVRDHATVEFDTNDRPFVGSELRRSTG